MSIWRSAPARCSGCSGPNGAGKTTAVRILATLLTPGRRPARRRRATTWCARRTRCAQLIGLTGQYASVDETLTGTENLLLIGRLLGHAAGRGRARARELLADFRLDDAADRAAKTYSGGMRRRLDLAASLVGRPQLLFLDEPTTGLDPRARSELWDIIRDLVAGGVTVLLTTQYLDEADQLADDIVGDRPRPGDRHRHAGGAEGEDRRADARGAPGRRGGPAEVVAVVGELAGADAGGRRRTVTAPVTDPAVLPAVVRRLDDAGVRHRRAGAAQLQPGRGVPGAHRASGRGGVTDAVTTDRAPRRGQRRRMTTIGDRGPKGVR